MYKNIVATNAEKASQICIMDSFFFEKVESRRNAAASEIDKYYDATKFVMTDLFAKRYMLIPINKQ